jgi:phosphorylcholine metabolism protein LicD
MQFCVPTALAFGTKMCEKHKSTSPSVIQVKYQRKAISTDEKLDAISCLEKDLLTYGIMLDLLILAYVQFMIMLVELQKVRN